MKAKTELYFRSTFLVLVVAFFACFVSVVAGQQDRQLVAEKSKTSDKRTALIIGNANYTHAKKLNNSVNDATDMSVALKELGFDVIAGTDLTLKQMREKVREFGDRLKINGGVGLFYYAGYGIQSAGINYLLPVDADIQREDEVESLAYTLDALFGKMASANNGFNIVILDASKNNPFSRSWNRSIDSSGLAQVNAPTGTFVAFANDINKTVNETEGRNGLYTREFLKVVKKPYIKIQDTFKEVQKLVAESSKGSQTPWVASSFSGEFYFSRLLTNAAQFERWREMMVKLDYATVLEETTLELERNPRNRIALRWYASAEGGLEGSTSSTNMFDVEQIYKGISSKPTDEYELEVDCHFSRNKPVIKDAVESCGKAIEMNPSFAAAYLRRGQIYVVKKEYDLAISDLTQAIKLNPTPGAFQARARALTAQDKLDAAMKDISQALAMEPRVFALYLDRAAIHMKTGAYEQAVSDYTTAMEKSPRPVAARYISRGSAYEKLGRLDLAKADYSRAIGITPNHTAGLKLRAAISLQQGDLESSLNDLSQAIAAYATFMATPSAIADVVELYRARANIYERKGDTVSAKADRDRASELEKRGNQPK